MRKSLDNALTLHNVNLKRDRNVNKVPLQIHKGYQSFFHFHSPFPSFSVLTPFQLSPSWNQMSGPKDSSLSLLEGLQLVQYFLPAAPSH